MSAGAETIIVARDVRPTHRRTSRTTTPQRRPAAPPRLRPAATTGRGNPPARARTGVFAVFVLMILTVGLLGMLWINTTLAQGAFTLTDLQQQRAQLIEVEQQLTEELARADAPAQLEQSARELGMVPQDVPVFLRLEDGLILGEPIPQEAPTTESATPEDAVSDVVTAEDSVADVVTTEGEVAIEEPVAEGTVTP